MTFASTYFSRFTSYSYAIEHTPHADVGIIVVIPCYNEPDIADTLQSLLECKKPTCNTEVIIVINHAEDSPQEIVQTHEDTYHKLKDFCRTASTTQLQFHIVYSPNLPKKHAGVGLARKIGMDEAVRRFSIIHKPNGIIASLDADSLVADTYLHEIDTFFSTHSSCAIAPIYFEHPLQGSLPPNQYSAIAQYELYLRWYVYMLTSIGFPYAYHTVGSSFAVRAQAYCRQGGMNKRKAGEDFYFLQKMYEAECVGTIYTTTVYPSARISTRVPFGTGYAMFTLMNSSNITYYCYHPQSFITLKELFNSIPTLYNCTEQTLHYTFSTYHSSLQQYIILQEFVDKIHEIRKNSTSLEQFTKRFFHWFNSFMVFKYLNTAHISDFNKIPIIEAASRVLQNPSYDVFQLLQAFRHIELSQTTQNNF